MPTNSNPSETVEVVHPVVPWLTAQRRAWLYRVATSIGGIMAFYGHVADEALPLWLGLGSALVGSTVATIHTPANAPYGDAPSAPPRW